MIFGVCFGFCFVHDGFLDQSGIRIRILEVHIRLEDWKLKKGVYRRWI